MSKKASRYPIKGDSRYTIAKEFCGQPKQMYIARFCMDWLGKGENWSDAAMLCLAHKDSHRL